VAALLIPMLGPSTAPAGYVDPFTFGNPEFCGEGGPVRDFGLSRMPTVREVPGSGEELGHPAVSIYGGGMFGRVMPRPQTFGYGFSESNYTGTVRLDWTVTAQLWAANRTGEPTRQVDRKELFIGRLDAVHLCRPSVQAGVLPLRHANH
jgi:hypothetical protein